jgi:hypothetical protein
MSLEDLKEDAELTAVQLKDQMTERLRFHPAPPGDLAGRVPPLHLALVDEAVDLLQGGVYALLHRARVEVWIFPHHARRDGRQELLVSWVSLHLEISVRGEKVSHNGHPA